MLVGMKNWAVILLWFAAMSTPALLVAWTGNGALITLAALIGWIGGGALGTATVEAIISRQPGSSPSRR